MNYPFSLGKAGGTIIFLLLLLSVIGCKKKDECDGTIVPQLGTCTAVTATGNLTQSGDTFVYRTSGGGIITIDSFTLRINHDDYSNFKIEMWGGDSINGQPAYSLRHENLNGKHIKDKLNANRTLILPDGAKVTMAANDTFHQVLTITIYDGAQCHRINYSCRKLEYSASNLCVTQAMDNAEADGEASSFEITSTGLLWYHLYTENTAGNKVNNYFKLGELEIGNLNFVRDWFDDPRIAHT